MVQHFTKDEIEELRSRLSGNSKKDTDFEEAHDFTRSDLITIVQEGLNKKLSLDTLFGGLVRGLDEEFMQDEKLRQENETIRIVNETERISSETARQESEKVRTSSETTRTENESLRTSAETERVSAEENRVKEFANLSEQTTEAIKKSNEAVQSVIDVFTLMSESEYSALEKKDNNKLYLVYEDE